MRPPFRGAHDTTSSLVVFIGQMFSMGMTLLLFALYIGPVQISPENYPVFLTCVKTAFIVSAILCFGGIFASIARGRTHRDSQNR